MTHPGAGGEYFKTNTCLEELEEQRLTGAQMGVTLPLPPHEVNGLTTAAFNFMSTSPFPPSSTPWKSLVECQRKIETDASQKPTLHPAPPYKNFNHSPYVREIDVDDSRSNDYLGDTYHALMVETSTTSERKNQHAVRSTVKER